MKVCTVCNCSFYESSKKQMYCSVVCYEKNRGSLKICTVCKREYKGRSKRKFCSSKCFGLSTRELVIARNIKGKVYQKVEGLTTYQVKWRVNPDVSFKQLSRDSDRRKKVINYLGGKCISCGYSLDIRALVLDYINSDGKIDRLRLGSRIARYYVHNLEEAKSKLQVLCANCNTIKSIEKREHNVSRRVINLKKG